MCADTPGLLCAVTTLRAVMQVQEIMDVPRFDKNPGMGSPRYISVVPSYFTEISGVWEVFGDVTAQY